MGPQNKKVWEALLYTTLHKLECWSTRS